MTEDVEMKDAEEDEAEVEGELQAGKSVLSILQMGFTHIWISEEEYTEEESDEEVKDWGKKHVKNSGMAVGYKGIAVVLRGDQVGIFKETTDGKLELGGTVNEVKGPSRGSKAFNPSKVCNTPNLSSITTNDHCRLCSTTKIVLW
jgi:hypothetical protein